MVSGPQSMAGGSAGAAVQLRSVSVAYPTSDGAAVTAVRDADLTIEPGSIVALLGPSGCGKTSLLRSIAGLEAPAAGSIEIDGRVVSSQPTPDSNSRRVWVRPEQRDVGMVFQDGALFPHLTVRQNIAFGLNAKRSDLTRVESTRRVDDLLELVDLAGFGDRHPATLSGGQQQRVALARSLAPQPKVLLLDEPFSALDTALRVQVRAEVASILRDVGVTAVFVTHDQDEAFVLGDKVAVMQDGRIEQFGTPDQLYRSPQTPWVAGFVGEANFLAGTLDHHDDSVDDAALAETAIGVIAIDDHRSDPLTSRVQVLVRPEQIALLPLADTGSPSSSSAVITAVEYYGHDVRYELQLDDGATLAARTHSTELFQRGSRVIPTFQSHQRDSRSAAFSPDDVSSRAAPAASPGATPTEAGT